MKKFLLLNLFMLTPSICEASAAYDTNMEVGSKTNKNFEINWESDTITTEILGRMIKERHPFVLAEGFNIAQKWENIVFKDGNFRKGLKDRRSLKAALQKELNIDQGNAKEMIDTALRDMNARYVNCYVDAASHKWRLFRATKPTRELSPLTFEPVTVNVSFSFYPAGSFYSEFSSPIYESDGKSFFYNCGGKGTDELVYASILPVDNFEEIDYIVLKNDITLDNLHYIDKEGGLIKTCDTSGDIKPRPTATIKAGTILPLACVYNSSSDCQYFQCNTDRLDPVTLSKLFDVKDKSVQNDSVRHTGIIKVSDCEIFTKA